MVKKKSNHLSKVRRRESAAKCAEARALRSPEEQIAFLDSKLGKGLGAEKERARLTQQIAQRKAQRKGPTK